MPVRCGAKDAKGTYCRWGKHGKKYHYRAGNAVSKRQARAKATKQGRAAHAHGYRS